MGHSSELFLPWWAKMSKNFELISWKEVTGEGISEGAVSFSLCRNPSRESYELTNTRYKSWDFRFERELYSLFLFYFLLSSLLFAPFIHFIISSPLSLSPSLSFCWWIAFPYSRNRYSQSDLLFKRIILPVFHRLVNFALVECSRGSNSHCGWHDWPLANLTGVHRLP